VHLGKPPNSSVLTANCYTKEFKKKFEQVKRDNMRMVQIVKLVSSGIATRSDLVELQEIEERNSGKKTPAARKLPVSQNGNKAKEQYRQQQKQRRQQQRVQHAVVDADDVATNTANKTNKKRKATTNNNTKSKKGKAPAKSTQTKQSKAKGKQNNKSSKAVEKTPNSADKPTSQPKPSKGEFRENVHSHPGTV